MEGQPANTPPDSGQSTIPRPDGPPTSPYYSPQGPYQAPYQPGYYRPPSPAPERRGGAPWWVWLLVGLGIFGLVALGSCVALGFALGQFVSHFGGGNVSASSTQSQTFTVQGTPSLIVHNIAGDITIQTGGFGTVAIEADKRATDNTPAQAQSDLNLITVSLTQSGNAITVEVQSTEANASSPFSSRSVDLLITVPASANLDLREDAGNISVDGVHGEITTALRAGNVDVTNSVLADGSLLGASDGHLTFNGTLVKGASVQMTVATGGAQITLPAATGTHLVATTDIGDISITGWSVPVAKNGAGASATGDLGASITSTLRVQVSTGDIDVSAAA